MINYVFASISDLLNTSYAFLLTLRTPVPLQEVIWDLGTIWIYLNHRI